MAHYGPPPARCKWINESVYRDLLLAWLLHVQPIIGLTAFLFLQDITTDLINISQTSTGDTMAAGIRVAVHRRGTKADMKTAFNIGPGVEATVAISAIRRRRLEKPWGTCTKQQYIVPEENLTYSSDACVDFCKQKLVSLMSIFRFFHFLDVYRCVWGNPGGHQENVVHCIEAMYEFVKLRRSWSISAGANRGWGHAPIKGICPQAEAGMV